MKTNPDEPAFPAVVTAGSSEYYAGLSKLEIFTLAAMQGLLANPVYAKAIADSGEQHPARFLAACAVDTARATLAALEKEARP